MKYASVIFSFSIWIAGIIGIIRFSSIQRSYYPFLYLVWLACFNEVLSFVLILNGYYTIYNNNVYVLLESLLITWFFQRQGLFKRRPALFPAVLAAFTAVWLLESLVFRSLSQLSVYFRIFYSFVVVLMSISAINFLLATEHRLILRNALFLICFGFIIYYTLKVLVNAFWLYGQTTRGTFLYHINRVRTYVNLFTNLIYALAVLWVPRKQPSILQ